MIFDKLNNIGNYEGLDKIYDALVFLKSKDFSNVPIGKYILNEKIYYIVQEYCTHIESLYSEAHEEYVDIQFLVFGQEKIGIAQLTPDIVASRSIPENDLWYYDCEMQFLTLSEGYFMVLFPNDIHMPNIISGNMPVSCKKVVVKVKIK